MSTTRRQLLQTAAIATLGALALGVAFVVGRPAEHAAADTAAVSAAQVGPVEAEIAMTTEEAIAAAAAPTPVSAGSQANASGVARRASSESLPFETRLLESNYLASEQLSALLKADDFDKRLAAIEQEMKRDPLAIEQRDAFGAKISAQIGKDADGARLRQFVCGLEVCIGAIRGKTEQGYERFVANQFQAGQDSDIGAFTVVTPIEVDGEIERRFAFAPTGRVQGFVARPTGR